MHSETSAFLLTSIFVFCTAKNLPSNLDRCKENDDSTLNCIKDATQKAIKVFQSGIPSLGVLAIDPLKVTQMTIAQGDNSPVNIKLHFTDETIYGFGKMVIEQVKGSTVLDDYHLVFKVRIPNFQMIGDYIIDGRIMVLPITGKGFSNLTLVDLDTTAEIMGKPYEKKGEKYLQITDFRLNIEPARLYMHFENLFNGDKALGSHMNNFLNDNWQVIYRELKPSIADTFGAIFKDISNRIYSRVPYNKIVL